MSRDRYDKRRSYVRFTDEEKARALRLRKDGNSYREIAEALDIPTQRVDGFFRALKRRTESEKKPPQPPPHPHVVESDFIRPPTMAQLMGKR